MPVVDPSPEHDLRPRVLAPGEQRACAPLVLRIVGLPVGAPVRVRAVTRDRAGRSWTAQGVFRSARGVVDVAHDASLGGSYRGVEPDGLLTRMRPVGRNRVIRGLGFVPASPHGFEVHLTMHVAERAVAATRLVRVLADPAVTVRPFALGRRTGGALWLPPSGRERRPPVVVLAPARSPMARFAPGLLASRGYPTIGVPLPPRTRGRLGSTSGRARPPEEGLVPVLAASLAREGVDVDGVVLLGVASGVDLAVRAAAGLSGPGALVAYEPRRGHRRRRRSPGGTERLAESHRTTGVAPGVPSLVVTPSDLAAHVGTPSASGDPRRAGVVDARWISTHGWPPRGPGRLPGDALDGRVRHLGGEAWDDVLALLRSLSISGGAAVTDTAAVPVIPSRPATTGRH